MIRRYYRQMLSLAEAENHLASKDGLDMERIESLDEATDGLEIEKGLMQELNHPI